VPKLTVHKQSPYPRKTFAVWKLREARLESCESGIPGGLSPDSSDQNQHAETQSRYWTVASLGDLEADVEIHGSFFEAVVWLQNLRVSVDGWPVVMWAIDDPYSPALFKDTPEDVALDVWPSEEQELTGWPSWLKPGQLQIPKDVRLS